MGRKLIGKIGFYTIYKKSTKLGEKIEVDSGKTIYIARIKKTIPNPYRDVKEFKNYEQAKKYVEVKLKESFLKKDKKIKTLPKSLYLILIKEEESGKSFVKVGITSKRFIKRRFSKDYGYKGYVVETILRRIDSVDAEKLEDDIKNKLNGKKTIKKYRPLMESFSGYSECYHIDCLEEIIIIFDKLVKM